MSQTYEEVVAEIEIQAIAAVAEQGEDLGIDDACHDIAISYFWGDALPMDVKLDLARCYLGWDPEEDADLYRLHGLKEPK